MSRFSEGCLAVIIGFILVFFASILFSVIFAYFGMLLWNWIVPGLFGLPTITYWKMLGLMILLRILIPTSSSSSKNS